MREIEIRPRRPLAEVERLARALLAGAPETGDDEVLDEAVKIASDEGLPVTFRVAGAREGLPAELACRLRYERGLDLRSQRRPLSGPVEF